MIPVVLFGLAVALEIACFLGSSAYFRSVLPIGRFRVQNPAQPTPLETWLGEADAALRHGYLPLVFTRLSPTEVAFREQVVLTPFSAPAFVAGVIRERPSGILEVYLGPRWIVPGIWVLVLNSGLVSTAGESTFWVIAAAVVAVGVQYHRGWLIARGLRGARLGAA